MIRKLVFICTLVVPIALASACSRQPTVPVAEFGDAVRSVMDAQIHDYEAALHPEPDAVEGSDPVRLNNALDAYRQDVSEPQQAQQPISINVGQ
jgi:hypothetical protein